MTRKKQEGRKAKKKRQAEAGSSGAESKRQKFENERVMYAAADAQGRLTVSFSAKNEKQLSVLLKKYFDLAQSDTSAGLPSTWGIDTANFHGQEWKSWLTKGRTALVAVWNTVNNHPGSPSGFFHKEAIAGILQVCQEQKVPYIIVRSYGLLSKLSNSESTVLAAGLTGVNQCDKKLLQHFQHMALRRMAACLVRSSTKVSSENVLSLIQKGKALLVIAKQEKNSHQSSGIASRCIQMGVPFILLWQNEMSWLTGTTKQALCLTHVEPQNVQLLQCIISLLTDQTWYDESRFEEAASLPAGDTGKGQDSSVEPGEVDMQENTQRTTADVDRLTSSVGRSEHHLVADAELHASFSSHLEPSVAIGPSTSQLSRDTTESSEIPMPDMETIRLEEEVAQLEASLEFLSGRRQEVDKQLSNAKEESTSLDERLSALQGRSSHLSSTLEKIAWQKQLEESLVMSRKHLDRLMSHEGVFTVEEIAAMAASVEGADQLNDTEGDRKAGSSSSLPVHPSNELHEPESESGVTTELGPGKSVAGAVKDASADTLDESQCLSLARSRIPDPARLHLFWKMAGDSDASHKLAPFLPCIRSKNLLQSVLDVSVRETLALDKLEPSGRHRRESMWNTCLDVRLMASPRTSEDPIVDDDFRQADATVDMIQMEKPERAKKPSTAIDPTIPLCPYELAGTCADPSCNYQHLDERPYGKIIPRELLPLPPLSLSTHSQTAKIPALEPANSSTTRFVVAPTMGNGSSGNNDSIPNNSDFIALPTALDNEMEPANEAFADGDFYRLVRKLGLPGDRWTDTDRMNMVKVSAVLQAFGCRIGNSTDTIRTAMDACDAASMIIDMTGLFVHSGWYDIPVPLIEAARKKLSAFSAGEGRRDAFARTIDQILRVVDGAEGKAFAYDAVPSSNLFRVAFEAQVTLALSSFYFGQLRSFLEPTKIPVPPSPSESLDVWLFSAFEFPKAFRPGSDGLTADQDIAAFIKKDLFVLEHADLKSSGDESQKSSEYRSRVVSLLNDAELGGRIKTAVSRISSIRRLIDDILYPSTRGVKKMLLLSLKKGDKDEHSRIVLKAILLTGHIVLGTLESVAIQIPRDEQASKLKVELTELYTTVDKILLSLRSLVVCSTPLMDLLLSPLFAANIALACTIQLYDKAQRRLESLLVETDQTDSTADGSDSLGVNLASFSELLWSQLIQLRASLPIRLEAPSADEPHLDNTRTGLHLPKDVIESHELLASHISAREVFLHHVTLANDWNIVSALSKESTVQLKDTSIVHTDGNNRQPEKKLAQSCGVLLHALFSEQPISCSFTFMDLPLVLRQTHGQPSPFRSAMPLCLLAAGKSLVALDLSSTGLKCLPCTFGLYFPNLKSLTLNDNELAELPGTMADLSALESLSSSSNKLSSLPSEFGFPRLTELVASNNFLRGLPSSIAFCLKLEILNLEGNPLETGFWSVVAQLPKLRELLPQP